MENKKKKNKAEKRVSDTAGSHASTPGFPVARRTLLFEREQLVRDGARVPPINHDKFHPRARARLSFHEQ